MDGQQVLSKLDYCLIFIGCKVFKVNRMQRFFNYLFRFLVYLNISLLLAVLITKFDAARYLVWMRFALVFLAPATMHTMLTLRLEKIRHLVNSIVDTLSTSGRRSVCRQSLVFVAINVAFVALDLAFHLMSYYGQVDGHHNEKYFVWKNLDIEWYQIVAILVVSIIADATIVRRWVLVIVSLYSVVLISWSKCHGELISAGTVISVINPELCDNLIKKKKQLQALKTEFNDCFAVFPLLILSTLFLESSGLFMRVRYDGMNLSNMVRLALYAINMTLTIFLVLLAINVQRNELIGNQQVIGDWRLRLACVTDSDVKTDFKETFNYYKPLDAILFDLDRTLFLGFAGSLITFTVMTLQFKGSE
ncbi:hypothetical protein HDE_04792 [Halotydeus destructor]|nr:hypothetical protein HDE_04792 [Halotydeus destructor]